MFKCSYCGKFYNNAVDRAHCEIECSAKQKTMNEAKLKDEKEIETLLEKINTKVYEYTKKYGEYIPPQTFQADLDRCSKQLIDILWAKLMC